MHACVRVIDYCELCVRQSVLLPHFQFFLGLASGQLRTHELYECITHSYL